VTAWDGTPIIATERLVLRTYRAADLPVFAKLNAHPDVYRTLSGRPLSREHSDEIAAWAQQVYVDEGIGLLAVERLVDGVFLGMCGLHHQESFPDDLEVAWRFAPEHWGHGYATEAAGAWLDRGFDQLGAERIISTTDLDNLRSLGVMRRLGMQFDHTTRIVDDGEEFDAVVYVISAEQWAAKRREDGRPGP
jgi:RimJ/RimL family protein N-acetyltransferase